MSESVNGRNSRLARPRLLKQRKPFFMRAGDIHVVPSTERTRKTEFSPFAVRSKALPGEATPSPIGNKSAGRPHGHAEVFRRRSFPDRRRAVSASAAASRSSMFSVSLSPEGIVRCKIRIDDENQIGTGWCIRSLNDS
jgi:hypothetical protein